MAVDVLSVERVSPVRIKLTITGLQSNTPYTIAVNNIESIDGNLISSGENTFNFEREIPAPRVLSVASQNYTTIRCTFDKAMLADSDLTTPSNYVIVGDTTITVTSISVITSEIVDITISTEMLTGGAYTLTVSNVKDTGGNIIDPAHNTGSFTGVGVEPQVSSAASTGYNTVRVVFDSPMSNTGLTTNGNYSFACPVGATITVSSVTKINSTTVDITTLGEMLIGAANYSVAVTGVTDVVGNPINLFHNSATFNGSSDSPSVDSAAYVDANTITVTFSENMDPTTAETAGNYTLTGPTTPNVTTATLVGATVTLELDANLIHSNYTVNVSGVTDLVGNVIVPNPGTAIFLANTTMNWAQAVPVASPGARWVAPMAFDSGRNVVVLHGGYLYLNDTWEYNGATWTNVTPAGVKPAGRFSHALAYDSARGVTVLFGGQTGGDEQDTWEWDGAAGTWTLMAPAGGVKPSARKNHTMAYDSARGVVVLFGGNSGGNETWEWDGITWVQKAAGAVTKPASRTQPAMAYDASRGVCVLFGGAAPAVNDETWEWDGVDWVQKAAGAVTKPSPRHRLEMVYDSTRHVCVLFGGDTGAFAYNNETWEWDGAAWVQKAPATSPGIRMEQHGAYDSTRHVTIIYAGYNGAGMNDTWEYGG